VNNKCLLSVKDLNYKYCDKYILKNINFDISYRQLVVIQGISGSGKTTLAELIVGYLEIQNGDIYLNNLRINNKNIYERKIRYVEHQVILFDDLSIEENILFGIRDDMVVDNLVIEKIDKLLKYFNFKHDKKCKVSNLSNGYKYLTTFIRAIISPYALMILDEPFNDLDINNKYKVLNLITQEVDEKNTAYIIITHDCSILNQHKYKKYILKNNCLYNEN